MTTRMFAVLALLLSALCTRAAEPPADFYASPDGNDNWSGKLPAPNSARTDGPFATPLKSIEAARALPRESGRLVLLRGGTYHLDKPLLLTPADSGLTLAAYADEKPFLSGGQRLTGWTMSDKGHWVATLPQVKAGRWNFTQLWADGQRRYRPRLPKKGYYHIAEQLDPTAKNAGKGSDRFKFTDDEIRANWHSLGDVEVLAFQVWTMARLRVQSVDASGRIVSFTGPTRSLEHYQALQKGKRYLVENVKDALSEPGEWYLDRSTGQITYIPLPGEQPDKTEIIAPRLESLVQIQGDPANGQFVSKLTLRGLTFAHSNWVTPPEGNAYPQAEVNLSAAVSLVGARDCALEQCTIRNVGIYAIELGASCRNNRIESCDLLDLGAGGVKIGLTRNESNAELLTSHNTVRDCRIAHGGRLHPAAIGVWVGHSPHNTIDHNEIADFYYTGISHGWSWGYNPAGAHHNTYSWNHVHKIGQGVLSDMGGIYTLGLSEGSVCHHNFFHDIIAYDYGGWGIYYDEGTTHFTSHDNVVYNVKTGGFHQHYGKENIVRNNIFAFSMRDQVQRTRPEAHLSFTFERNIVYWNSGPLLGSNWKDDKFALEHNLYWRTDGKPIDFAGQSLEQWRARGHDRNSLIADPLFIDPSKGDFRLKPGSPSSKIGFQPIDLTGVGASRPPVSTDVRPAFPTGLIK